MKSTVFWDITLCSPLKVNRRFGGTYRLHLQGRRISRAINQQEAVASPRLCWSTAFTLVSCSAYYSTLNMEAICSSETSVDFQRTTQRYIPEDNILNSQFVYAYHLCSFLSHFTAIFGPCKNPLLARVRPIFYYKSTK
jgi:hypothetical protein